MWNRALVSDSAVVWLLQFVLPTGRLVRVWTSCGLSDSVQAWLCPCPGVAEDTAHDLGFQVPIARIVLRNGLHVLWPAGHNIRILFIFA